MRTALVFVLLAIMPFVAAHGFGNTQYVQSGNHTLEFGITNATPAAGDRVGMSFSIDQNGTPVGAPAASVRISRGDDIHFVSSGFTVSDETLLTMSFIFPESGAYDIDLTAGDDRATFGVHVADAPQRNLSWVWVIIAAAIGLTIGFAIPARK